MDAGKVFAVVADEIRKLSEAMAEFNIGFREVRESIAGLEKISA